PGKLPYVFSQLIGFGLRDIDKESSAYAPVVCNGLEQFGFMLLAHAGEFANLTLFGEFLHSIDIADLVRAPDQRDSLGTQSLDLQKLQHRRVIFIEQLFLQRELAFRKQLTQIFQHALANAWDREDLLFVRDDVANRFRVVFYCLSGVAVRTDAKGV